MKRTEKDPAAKAAEEKNPAAGNSAREAPAGTPDGDKDQELETPPDGEDTAPGEDATPEEEETSPDAAEPDAETPAGEAEESSASAEEQPATPPAEGGESERLKADLLQARSQLAAYAAGVAPEMVADAVTLATAEARAAGEVTEDAVAKAMENVLKRHPEWKAATAGSKKTGGFRLGADPDRTGRGSKKSAADKGSKKPWNKFNR